MVENFKQEEKCEWQFLGTNTYLANYSVNFLQIRYKAKLHESFLSPFSNS